MPRTCDVFDYDDFLPVAEELREAEHAISQALAVETRLSRPTEPADEGEWDIAAQMEGACEYNFH